MLNEYYVCFRCSFNTSFTICRDHEERFLSRFRRCFIVIEAGNNMHCKDMRSYLFHFLWWGGIYDKSFTKTYPEILSSSVLFTVPYNNMNLNVTAYSLIRIRRTIRYYLYKYSHYVQFPPDIQNLQLELGWDILKMETCIFSNTNHGNITGYMLLLSPHHHKSCSPIPDWPWRWTREETEESILITTTHWGRGIMADILQTTFSHTFSWMKMLEFQMQIH